MSTDRRGFILPTTLMVMTLLTVMLTAAFILISAESRTTDNSLAIGRAHALAQAGLQKYLTLNRGIVPSASSDSVRLNFSPGYADVVGTRMVGPNSNGVALWMVRSTGVLTGATLTGVTSARRTVAQLASFNPGVLPLRAAFVSAYGLTILPLFTADPISGTDACVVANKTGLTITNGTLLGTPGSITTEFLPSAAAVLDSSHIDWASLIAGNFTPDYIAPTWPGFSGYPIGYAPGNLSIASGGKVGTLVVRGDLILLPGAGWAGLLIVGGQVKVPVPIGISIEGAVIAGLNNLITPGSVGPDTLYQSWGSPTFQWNSCAAGNSVAAMASMSPMKNGYIDTWPSR